MQSSRSADPAWPEVAAEVLGGPLDGLAERAAEASFVQLGGTSLGAAELVGLAERRLGRGVDVAALLGPRPLAEVLAAARPLPPTAPDATPDTGPVEGPGGVTRPASASQQAMLLGAAVHGGRAFHLLFTADVTGPQDPDRLAAALGALTRRHEALRSVFVATGDGPRVRVLAGWEPRLLELPLTGPAARAGLAAALAADSDRLLRPYEQPPVVFAVTPAEDGQWALGLLGHHALLDGWSVGLLWRELAAAYGGQLPDGPAPSPDGFVAAERDPAARVAYDARVAALRGAPVRLEIPTGRTRPEVADGRGTRLTVELDAAQRDAAGRVAAACGVTRNAALLAAWALVLSRRTGAADLLVGVPGVGRLGERSRAAVGLGSTLVPVRCRVGGEVTGGVTGYVTGVAAALGEALDGVRVPVEQLAAALGGAGDPARNPLVQLGFAAHDDLVPDRVEAGGLALELHEGHCGGTVFDAILFVQRWGERPRLALEYAPAALGAAEATGLVAELGAALTGLAAGLDGPVAAVAALSPAQARRLDALGRGGPAPTEAGLWQLVEEVCDRVPDAPAVRDEAGAVTYRELRAAVERQSTALVAVGVRPGDRVALTLERSVAEVVAVLAVLRCGAAYVGVQAGLPPAVRAEVLRVARPAAVLTDPDRVGELPGVPVLVAGPDGGPGTGPVAPAAPADPDRPAYVGFTSGSTGLPKGVQVLHRGVVRMAVAPPYVPPESTERFLRLAPLAFDASTLELFVPLVAGGTVEVYPARPVVPAELAAFLADRGVTGAWLTAGLFRLVADDRPEAFRPLRHLLTGGDVVPPDQVRRVLAACPGLLVSNGYGPTENTTFTTVHHVRDPAAVTDPLPIGRPVRGTDVVVTDEAGVRLPPGAVGELCTLGPGLATGYLDAPAETARAFVTGPDGRRRYRTGDLVRWDESGRLRYLGRRDRQVKVRGYRIELDAVTAVLRAHPAVRDAVVAVTPDPADQRLVAGVVTGGDRPAGLVPALRAYAADRLAPQEVPGLWAVVDRLPVTGNGKVDVRRLVELARGASPAPGTAPETEEELGEVEEVIAAVWAGVLGTDDFGYQDRFFDVGGTSLQLPRLHADLLARLPGSGLSVLDLLRYPTIDALAGRVRSAAR